VIHWWWIPVSVGAVWIADTYLFAMAHRRGFEAGVRAQQTPATADKGETT